MRTRNELERLDAAGGPLLAETDSLVNADEEERILERILTSDRAMARPRRLRRGLVLAAAAAAVAIAVALGWSAIDRGSPSATRTHGHGHAVALSGAKIQFAGYHFRTPAGFKDSNAPCEGGATNSYAAAASADGGCVEAFYLLNAGKDAVAPDAQPIQVAGTQGFLVTGSDSLTLYAPLPEEGPYTVYLMLVGKGLTADQMVAIAESGLPSPS